MFRLRGRKRKQAQRSSRKGARSREALINMACDELASATTDTAKDSETTPAGPVLEMPYQGSRIMLKIKGVWVVSDTKRELYRAHRTEPMKKYCCEKYKWTSRVFDMVDEKSIDDKLYADDPDQGSIQSNYLIVFFCCISAFIVVVLIVGGMVLYIQGKSNEVSAFCCLLPDTPFCFR